MKIAWYQDAYFYYIWKPAGIPSTFGKQKSFLEELVESSDPDIQNIFKWQQEFFSAEQEYGLLNRLDTPTSGLLTFAKTPLFANQYRKLQAEHKIEKIYLAQVEGKFLAKEYIIDSTIAHSKKSKLRMIVLDPKLPHKKLALLEKKAKQRRHEVKTFCTLLDYNRESNTSLLEITIHKGIRHQIRAHLASIDFPIIGDTLYGKDYDILKSNQNKSLQLYCLGMKIK